MPKALELLKNIILPTTITPPCKDARTREHTHAHASSTLGYCRGYCETAGYWRALPGLVLWAKAGFTAPGGHRRQGLNHS
jgi:hypothetical protein